MSDAGDDNGFERRLAGQPAEPTADTQELSFAAAKGERTNADLHLGDLALTNTDISASVDDRSGLAVLLPWVVAGVLALVMLVLILGFIIPASSRTATLETELESAQARIAEQNQRIETLDRERAELQAANDALTLETERRAGELEALQRAEEERTAIAKRKPEPSPPIKKRKRSRRR